MDFVDITALLSECDTPWNAMEVPTKYWNLVFAHHEEEEEVYPLTLTEIADAQRKDQELKAYFK